MFITSLLVTSLSIFCLSFPCPFVDAGALSAIASVVTVPAAMLPELGTLLLFALGALVPLVPLFIGALLPGAFLFTFLFAFALAEPLVLFVPGMDAPLPCG